MYGLEQKYILFETVERKRSLEVFRKVDIKENRQNKLNTTLTNVDVEILERLGDAYAILEIIQ